jgi:pimeloyl-ACP methyl ester carboxylesterase
MRDGAWLPGPARVWRWAYTLAALGLVGCTSLESYHPRLIKHSEPQVCEVRPPRLDPVCFVVATEAPKDQSYELHFVEFDDQGSPFELPDGNPVDWAIGQIRETVRNSGAACVRLFVFVHGWRHNASLGDSDVQNFRDFLKEAGRETEAARQAGTDLCGNGQPAAPVRTVGLYVGWRGASLVDFGPLFVPTFWDRMSTAEHVAQGSVRELFGRLSTLAQYSAQPPSTVAPRPAPLHVYIIGHSFGASIAYRALAQALLQAFVEDLDVDRSGDDALVSQFLKMLVLVNPAIEAARFDPLFRAADKRTELCRRDLLPQAVDRCDRPAFQTPVLAIFSSEGDGATRSAFPIGRFLGNLFESSTSTAQGQAMRTTIGWDDNYRTHRLGLAPRCNSSQERPDVDGRYRDPGWLWCKAGVPNLALAHLKQESGQLGRTPYNGPLWNVQVSDKVIGDHSDIWNPAFKRMLLNLFALQPRLAARQEKPPLRAQMPAPDSSKVSAPP